MKRICRQHGISRWPSRKINKVNRSLTKLKRVIESVQGADGSFDITSLTTSPLPVAVGSISWPAGLNGSNQQYSPSSKPSELPLEKNETSTCRSPGSNGDQYLGERVSNHKELFLEQNAASPEGGKSANSSKNGSGSREESAGSPTSLGSCQGSPPNESAPPKDLFVSSVNEAMEFQPAREMNLTAAFSVPEALVTTEPQDSFGGMLVEDAGSSKDLRNLCPGAADAPADDRFPDSSWINTPCVDPYPRQAVPVLSQRTQHLHAGREMKSVTIKATYREDIIRFRIPLSCGIVELREEVAKRLKLELGTFDIKYLDDDLEWVLIACDADLHECLDISRSSGCNIIRLSIHDVMSNLGSSCESTGEL